jgi:hypothetical protein
MMHPLSLKDRLILLPDTLQEENTDISKHRHIYTTNKSAAQATISPSSRTQAMAFL